MRVAAAFALFLAASLLLSSAALADVTGSTVINATVPGFLGMAMANPEIAVAENYYFTGNLTVSQESSIGITVYLNKSDANGFLKFANRTGGSTYYQDDYAVFLQPGSAANVTIRAYVPAGQGFLGGAYDIPIYGRSLGDYRTNSTALHITVNNTNPIDDIEIRNIDPSSLYPGEQMDAGISIHKLYPPDMTDIQICYCISINPAYLCGPSYNNYGCEWKAITSWLNYSKAVTVSEDAGTHYLIVAVKYPGDEAIKRANSPQFLVREIPSPPSAPSGPSGAFAPSTPPQPKLSVSAPAYIEATPGDAISFRAEVRNSGSAAANASLGLFGLPQGWASVSPAWQAIGSNTSKNFSVSIALPETAFEQVYSLSLVAKSGQTDASAAITLIVASSQAQTAEFLSGEARSMSSDADKLLAKLKSLGLEVGPQETDKKLADAVLEAADAMFRAGNHSSSIAKSKEAIKGYESAMDSAKRMVELEYSKLVDDLGYSLRGSVAENDVIDAIRKKMSESAVLGREDRFVNAYEILLDAKRLLDQVREKMELTKAASFMLMFSAAAVMAFAVLSVALYRKKVSKFVRKSKADEEKKRLRRLFGRQVVPAAPGRPEAERKPRSERLAEIMSWVVLIAIILLFAVVVLLVINLAFR